MTARLQSERATVATETDPKRGRQLESLPGYLTEEFVSGTFFTELPEEQLTDGFLARVGSTLGDMLRRLHQADVYYNLLRPQGPFPSSGGCGWFLSAD